jgi:trehalose 6-phosphate synthase/phosphatase
MPTTGRLIIVSNRLPVRVTQTEGELTVRRSDGGLAAGLREPHGAHGGLWIGWPGDLASATDGERAEIMRRLEELGTVPVLLSADEIDGFYHRVSNGVLWPICHDRLDRLPLRVEGWDVYEAVNRKFADVVVERWRPGDTIWVHDYQLFLLPELVRERLPDALIGFFLHIPFPNPEIFFTLSHRTAVVEGMMGADVVGFHTRRYRGHFAAALRRLYRLEKDSDDTIAWRGRRVGLGVFPIGIDAASFAARAAREDVRSHDIMKSWIDERIIVGIDRLDYTKGISRRLLAIEQLLASRPQWRERVRFIQVAIPSRGDVAAYRTFRDEVEALVGRINGDFTTPTWTPIHYLHRSIPDVELSALYTRADAMLVTPLRDGMNLVAKEFIASRNDEDGVLILSEFAGAADELVEALIVNPYDVDSTAAAIHRALTMPREERRSRMRALRTQVTDNNVARWSDSFLSQLRSHERSRVR